MEMAAVLDFEGVFCTLKWLIILVEIWLTVCMHPPAHGRREIFKTFKHFVSRFVSSFTAQTVDHMCMTYDLLSGKCPDIRM